MGVLKAVLTLFAVLSFQAQATVIEFGSGEHGSARIPENYAGMTWRNIYLLNTADYINDPQLAGKTTSGDYVAYAIGEPFTPISFSSVSGVDFLFNGAFFSSYVAEGLTLVLTGYSSTGAMYQKYLEVSPTPTYSDFGWGVNRVDFSAFSSPRGYTGDPTKFLVDDIHLNELPTSSVPEPNSTVLMALALALLAFMERRRSHPLTTIPSFPSAAALHSV